MYTSIVQENVYPPTCEIRSTFSIPSQAFLFQHPSAILDEQWKCCGCFCCRRRFSHSSLPASRRPLPSASFFYQLVISSRRVAWRGVSFWPEPREKVFHLGTRARARDRDRNQARPKSATKWRLETGGGGWWMKFDAGRRRSPAVAMAKQRR